MSNLSSWAVLLPVFFTASTFAATPAVNTETMIITANRFEQPESSVLAPVTIIEREQIEESQARTVTDILKFLPGVEVLNKGGKGQSSSMLVRGTNSDHVLVLLDGVRISSATLGSTELGLLPTNMIERIEYIRGPRAAIYGSDAIGGVISIITKPDNDYTVNQLSLGAGGDNYYQAGWRTYITNDKGSKLQLNLNQEKSDAYNVKQGSNPEDEHGYESQVLLVGLEQQIGQYVSADLKGIQNTGYVQYDSDGIYTQSDNEEWQVAANLYLDLDVFHSQLQASKNSLSSENSAIENPSVVDKFETRRDSLAWINTLDFKDVVTANLGADWLKDDVSGSSQDYTRTSRINRAIFASVHGYAGPVTMEASARTDDSTDYGRNNTWNVAAGWQIIDSTKFTASHGTAFKAPTFNDLYWPDFGNPYLEPETSATTELGFRGIHSLLSWQLTAYQNDIENLIEWAPTGEIGDNGWGIWKPANVASAKIKGIELELNFDTGPVEHVMVAEYLDPKDEDRDKQLIERSKEKFKWQGRYELDSWILGLDYLYRGKRYADNANTIELGSYSLWELSTSYQFNEALVLRARIENLFDKEYESAQGYKPQERIGFINASYQF